MIIFDNINYKVYDDLKKEIKKGTKIAISELHPKSWTQDWRCSFYHIILNNINFENYLEFFILS